MPSSPSSDRRPWVGREGSSPHRVAAAGHAGPERALVIGASLGHGVLLLRHVHLLLLLLLLLHLLLLLPVPHSPHTAEQGTHAGTDGRALARVAADGATDRPQGRAAEGPTAQPALGSLRCRGIHRGWRRLRHWGVRRVEACLLDGPAVALTLVGLLLLEGLA